VGTVRDNIDCVRVHASLFALALTTAVSFSRAISATRGDQLKGITALTIVLGHVSPPLDGRKSARWTEGLKPAFTARNARLIRFKVP
jgi:hypothetical protein